jgi:pyruvate/2-oxoglutarate dehydrogenase complex dihydrolipoamide dehydrogenase (E3) component
MKNVFDAVIVGAGQAAALAGRLTQAGWKVALVEKQALGGTCVNRGCTPTKAMVASAKAAHTASRGADFGLIGGAPVRVDMAKVKARKDAIVTNFRARNDAAFAAMAGCTLIYGTARFESPDSVRVGDDVLTAKHIFLKVGARPRIPPMPGADKVPSSRAPRFSIWKWCRNISS